MLKRLKYQPVDENMWRISSRDYFLAFQRFSVLLIVKFTIILPELQNMTILGVAMYTSGKC